MAFSSFPAIYLDHPNLQQQQQQQQQQLVHRHGSGSVQSSQIYMVDDGLTPPGGGSSIRPGSMVDKARLAKLPAPEAGVKCPRCDSSNTKFCYYNNYNLLQPRHFCKTCRRYWTKGGTLRNVPVGGGSRRNKKTKTTNSKQTTNSANSGGTTPPCGPSNSNPDISMSMSSGFPQSGTHLPLMAALQNLNHYAVGPNLGGFPANMGFSLGRNYGGDQNDLSAGGMEPWRLTPIGGYEQLSNNLFHFPGEGIETASPVIGEQHLGSLTTTQADVKPEEIPAENLRKQFHSNPDNNGQFWSGNPWTGFSGHSSSTSHLL